MSETATQYPHVAWKIPGQVLLALFAGAPVGLATSRVLYEADPARFAAAGGPAVAVAVSLLVAAVFFSVIYWAERLPGLTPQGLILLVIPLQLLWAYIATPPLQVNPSRGLILLGGALGLAIAFGVWEATGRDRSAMVERVGAALSVAIVLAGYLLTLQRTIGKFDTFEFQVTLPVLGIAHPTGYPLYTLLGKLFSILPLGMVATRINLLSTVSAAGTVFLTYAMLRRLLEGDIFVAALAGVALGFSPIFWSQAVAAEVYALHSVLAAAVLALTLWLVERGNGETGGYELFNVRVEDSTLVILIFALTGLGLTNHLTTVLLMPGIAIALLMRRPHLTRQQWLWAVGLFFGSLLIYLYLPLRWPFQHDGYQISPQQFVDWVTAEQFRGALNLQAWLHDPDRWPIIGRFILEQYGWPGVVLSSIGALLMLVRRWRIAVLLGSLAAGEVFFGLNYLVFDINLFLLPLYTVQAMWMAYAVSTAIEWLSDPENGLLPGQWRAWAHVGLVSALALIPLSAAWNVGPTFDWAEEEALEVWGRYVLSQPIDENAVILADIEKVAPLEYLHRIEGVRPDVEVVVLDAEEEIFGKLFTSLEEGHPVYLARFLPTLEGAFHLRSVGPLIEVGTEPLVEPPPINEEVVSWENGAELLGYTVGANPTRVGEATHLTLYWRARETLSDNFHVWLRLVNTSGEVVWEDPPAYAVDNRYPTVAWKAGEIIPDYHEMLLPFTLDPGTYVLQVSLTPPFSGELARLADGEASWAEVATLEVEPARENPAVPGERVAIAFEGGALVGVDVPERAPDGGSIQISGGWRVEEGIRLTASEVTADEGSVALPVPTSGGELRLLAEEEQLEGQNALAWGLSGGEFRCGWLRPLTGSCLLAMTRLESLALSEAVANFDDQLLLTDVQFQSGEIEPGGVLPVTLEWQGLRSMDEDYTVFVHLVGPDGRLWGQHDGGPVHSTYPTSIWQAGEYVVDRHNVPLREDAPPGNYSLQVGLYLLSTNERVVVLGDDGRSIDDKVRFEGLAVP